MSDTTPENIEKLIEKLATRGEVIEGHDDGTKTFILSPILIGDVLQKMQKARQDGECFTMEHEARVLDMWRAYGFTRSLQEIFEESDYRNQSVGNTGVVEQRLRKKEARELAEFLIDLFEN